MTTASPNSSAEPLVTLSLKAFNQERLIGEAITSCLAQTYSPLEIILSDDCSSDRTYEIMTDMAAAYRGPHAVVVNRNPRNLGIVGHMNRMAEIASGRLLIVAAGDDLSEPQRVATLAAAWIAGAGRVKAVHSAFIEVDEARRVLGAGAPDRRIIDQPGPDPLTLTETKANGLGATAAWDRELFEHFGPIPEECRVEDGVLFFRAALLGDIAYVDEPLIRYRTGGLSRPRAHSPGHDYLYGDRIKFLRWEATNARSFLRDLDAVEFPDKEKCRRICQQIVERVGFEVELADRGMLSRIAMVPRAIAQSLRTSERFFAVQSIKHALGPAYVAYLNHRTTHSGEP